MLTIEAHSSAHSAVFSIRSAVRSDPSIGSVTDVVGDREPCSDGDETDREHCQRRPESGDQHDGRGQDDEADIHDVGQRHHRGLVRRGSLDPGPVQQQRQDGNHQETQPDRDELVQTASHHVAPTPIPHQILAQRWSAQAGFTGGRAVALVRWPW
jgi:hypothetical protein